MKTFAAKFVHSDPARTQSHVAIIVRDRDSRAVLKVADRHLYSMTEAAHTADWLNDRAKGYPVNDRLQHLFNGQSFRND
jgi:hypothetical protein